MDKLEVIGKNPLIGDIYISGSKNASLPLMATSLLVKNSQIFNNLPNLADTESMIRLLEYLGVKCNRDNETITCNPTKEIITKAPYNIVRKMRGSILVLGPLLARHGKAKVSLPGGCAIGTRPINLHILAMKILGANVTLKNGYIIADAPNGLKGGHIYFPTPSVGATENALMAASIANGETIIENAAREPEIVNLADCLNDMGARITGQGESTIRIQGVPSLSGCSHEIIPDRIETGTFAIAVALTGGKITLHNTRPDHLSSFFEKLSAAGVNIEINGKSVTVSSTGNITPVDIKTGPYPEFPTDLQAQFMALMSIANGTSHISETIFENRYMHVPELLRMGANIKISGNIATIQGVKNLNAAQVLATDLRASVSLVLAGLVCEGKSTIQRVYHLDRGYDKLEKKLSACGANIKRIHD